MPGTKAENKEDFPLHLFHHGVNYKAYEFFGAHEATRRRKKGFVFRVWAPRAKSVSLVGEFNRWDPAAHVMSRLIDGETFEIFVEGIPATRLINIASKRRTEGCSTRRIRMRFIRKRPAEIRRTLRKFIRSTALSGRIRNISKSLPVRIFILRRSISTK